MNSITNISLEDCIEALKRFEDNYFDAALIDPPSTIKKHGHFANKPCDTKKPTLEYWNELLRVSKNQIVFGNNYITKNPPPSMSFIFWEQNADLSDGRIVSTLFAPAYITLGPLMVEDEIIHPYQKPIKLYDWVIQKYCADANLILDPYIGSGSSRISAVKANKQLIGFEIDPEYYEKQEKRFDYWDRQLRLF